ncbi:MAG: hypothetical protein ICCCNLDF_02068 [Planctomycetes bacterium]|nr:hypothetical protein [Planctomycetota bacterium]
MGLAVCVGMLADLVENDEEGAQWFRDELETLSAVLQANGLPGHEEPEEVEQFTPSGIESIPYSFLHYLRRAYVCVRKGIELRRGEFTGEDQRLVDEFTNSTMDSHLLVHSDAEGFYVPQDFAEPVSDENLTGGFAGSTQRLKAELAQVAPALGIRLEGADLPDEERERLAGIEDDDELEPELIVWLALWEAAEHSLKHNSLIVFA